MTAARPPWELAADVPADTVSADTVPADTGRPRIAPRHSGRADASAPDAGPESAREDAPGAGPGSGPRDASPAADGLPARLTALARLVQIGSARTVGDGFSKELLRDSEELLARAGERLRLSAAHTVVALAGGTGSGKSSLFNRLAGADFSTVGVTRPVTRDVHACVWGVTGAGPLLEWLGVLRRYRYARSSALGRGERSMSGLVLLDLPDHDSVVSAASSQVARLVGLADLMLWVLDPQKYADAAVHQRFLEPLSGHSEVIAVVLNQADLLSPGQVEDCISDLRRLLDGEGLHDAPVLVTSAVTDSGLADVRKLLADTVAERKAASAKISADVDAIVARFAPYAGELEGDRSGEGGLTVAGDSLTAAAANAVTGAARGGPDAGGAQTGAEGDSPAADAQNGAPQNEDAPLPAGSTKALADAFARAAGVSAVADAVQSARELKAMDYVGWPVGWLVERTVGGDPVRKVRLGKLWEELRGMTAGPSGAQQAEIDSALTRLGDEAGGPLPAPWSQAVRRAVRSRAKQIPAALGAAMGDSLPSENRVRPWWRVIGAWQGLLLGCVVVALAWAAAVLIFGVFHAAGNVPRLFSQVSLLPWIAIMLVAFLLLGWLTTSGSMNVVRIAAARERERLEEAMRARMAMVGRDLVLVPATQELSEYRRFLDEFRTASGS